MNPSIAFQAFNTDPKGYYAALMKQYEATELQKNSRYMGISPQENATAERAKMIRDPAIHKALMDLLYAVEKLVAGPNENDLFWHPERESYSEAEKRFDDIRSKLSQPQQAWTSQ